MVTIGVLIGLSRPNHNHLIGVYIGNNTLIIVYQHRSLIYHSALERIEYLVRNNMDLGVLLHTGNFFRRYLTQLQKQSTDIKVSSLDIYSQPNFFEIMRHNFNEMNSLQIGDVIFFQRSGYDHAAIMYKFQKFEIIHKNTRHPVDNVVRSQILEMNQNKAIEGEVRTNYLLDVIYKSKIFKRNYYDDQYPPL
jgi:hypothetical protein